MRTRIVRVEQKDFNQAEVDRKINSMVKELEGKGAVIRDIRIAVGRDADIVSKLKKRFSITCLILYD